MNELSCNNASFPGTHEERKFGGEESEITPAGRKNNLLERCGNISSRNQFKKCF
jgi:hypothetical protein